MKTKCLKNTLLLSTLLMSGVASAEIYEEVLSCKKTLNSHSACSHATLNRRANLIKANIRAANEKVLESKETVKEDKTLLENYGIHELTYTHVIRYEVTNHERHIYKEKCFHSRGNDSTADFRAGRTQFNSQECSYDILERDYIDFEASYPLFKVVKAERFVEKDYDFPIVHENLPQTYKKFLVKKVVYLLPK